MKTPAPTVQKRPSSLDKRSATKTLSSRSMENLGNALRSLSEVSQRKAKGDKSNKSSASSSANSSPGSSMKGKRPLSVPSASVLTRNVPSHISALAQLKQQSAALTEPFAPSSDETLSDVVDFHGSEKEYLPVVEESDFMVHSREVASPSKSVQSKPSSVHSSPSNAMRNSFARSPKPDSGLKNQNLISSLKQSKDSIQSELDRTQKELAKTTARLVESQTETTQAREENIILDSQLQTAKKELRRLESNASDAQKTISELESKIQDLQISSEKESASDDRIRQLEQEIQGLQQKLETAESRILVEESNNRSEEELERKIASFQDEYEFRIQERDQELALVKKELELVKNDYLNARALLMEKQDHEERFDRELNHLRVTAEQAQLEKNEIWEILQQERRKFQRQDAEFKLFSSRIKNLMELNGNLRRENEEIRIELRKLQYEVPGVSGVAEEDNFFKDRLEQALLQNETLKRVGHQLYQENDHLRKQASQPGGIESAPKPIHTSDYFSPKMPSYHRASPSASRSRSSPTPGAAAGGMLSMDISEEDRNVFLQKMRRYEESISPTPSFTPKKNVNPTSPFNRRQSLGGSPSGMNYLPERDTRSSTRQQAWTDGPTSTTPSNMYAGNVNLDNLDSVDFITLKTNLEADLRNLTSRKLESEYQRIPLSKGAGPLRKRKEDLENELDQVSAAMGRIKQTMKKLGIF